MIRPRMCLVAEAIVRDSESNQVSAFNVLDGMVPAGFPFFMQHIHLYTLFVREQGDPEEVEVRFTVNLGDEVLNTAPIILNFAGELRYRSIVKVNGLLLPRPGPLIFRMALQNGQTAEYIVDVEPAPAIAQPVPAVPVQAPPAVEDPQ